MEKVFKKHYDLILGFLIFIFYRYVFNFLLFYKRSVPPEPDDSYFYLANAANAFSPDTFEAFRLLPFSLWLKLLSVFTNSNLETAYQLNFYLGPILMFAALAYFLHRLETSKKIRLFLIFIITLYSGTGTYHGFYWVVPSFYQLALFFIALSIVISQKIDKFWKIFTAVFAFIFIHPTSVFISSIFLAYPFVFSAILRKIQPEAFIKTAKVLFALAISYSLYVLAGLNFPHAGSPESFETIRRLLTDFISGNLRPESFPIIWSDYFSIFFLNPLTIAAYILMLFFVYKTKRQDLIAVYSSALILVLFSSFLPYGWRTLGFLWPLTFLMIGYAIVGLAASFKKSQKLALFTVSLVALILFLTTTIFNRIYISSVNLKANYDWDRSCTEKLVNKTVYFPTLESRFAFVSFGFGRENAILLDQNALGELTKQGGLILDIQDELPKPYELLSIEKLLTENVTRRENKAFNIKHENIWGKILYDIDDLNLQTAHLGKRKIYDCGKFSIYELKKI